MIQTLTISGWQPTLLNLLLRANRYKRSKMLHNDAAVVAVEAHQQGITHATGRRRLSLLIVHRKQDTPCDPDALFKSLNDALRKCKRLKDDNGRWLELGPVTYATGRKKGIVVTLEDLPCSAG